MLDFSSLNPQQCLAVETTRGPVLILAGAGTGKTRVITCRIGRLIERGIAPQHILAVTFTNKAAREMLERVHRMLPETTRPAGPGAPDAADAGGTARTRSARAARPTICTFHALGVRLLRQHIERLGYKPNFVIYSEADQLGVVKKILSHISAKGEKTDPQAILALLSRLRNEGAAGAFADPSVAAMAEHIRARYENALRACNAVDFDDLLGLSLRLLEGHPDILAAWRDRFRYVMVDEYQDTNAAQFRLVHLLTAEHRNLCVVGDDDQSIYGWRGAQIANLLDMEKHFPEVKVVKLEQNYRSTNVILRAANAVIRNNTRRRGKQLWSQQGPGAKIALHTFANDTDEARGIVDQLEYARLARRSRWADHAVLFRTNQQSRPLETALRQAGVRYHLIGGQSYFDRREVKDFLAYLKVFANPHDDVSLLRIANVPARGLSDATMQRLLAASHERHASVFSVLPQPDVAAGCAPRTRESLDAFHALIERTRAPLLGDAPLALRPWAEGFLAETGYLEDLRRSEKDAETAENRVRNVQALVADLESLDPEGNMPVNVFGTDASSPRPSPPPPAEESV
ncbi:MAG: UvrD-helicase domain-containing protein, partial [Verrucomicrobia bacterium]|nr:UvrD-helicase domain-containing protein [Verrucomicrobiota bacterium]